MACCTVSEVRQILDPRCGFKLQTLAQAIAITTMGISFVAICIFGYLLLYYLANGIVLGKWIPFQPKADRNPTIFVPNPEPYVLGSVESWIIISIFTTKLLVAFLMFMISKYLSDAVEKRNYTNLRRWIQLNIVIFIAQIIVIGIQGNHNWTSLLGILGLIYLAYSIWVVYCFKSEVALDILIEKTLLLSEVTKRPLFFTRL